jgi:CHAT domain-containing protein
MAVGDGHDPAATGMPRLPRADDEANAVGSLYPERVVLRGPQATKRRFLDQRATVIHFAGHTVISQRFPMFSRMLLAPDAVRNDAGLVTPADITPQRFSATKVAVLATCEGATGRLVSGEGPLSMARAFFAAGVPAVVASLWPVPDDLQPLATTLHRELRATRDPASALRAAQLAVLASGGSTLPVQRWGGFVAFGGIAAR